MLQVRVNHAVKGPWFHGTQEHSGEPPGLLHGDLWDPATNRIQRAHHGMLVGIVDFVGKTRYGFSSRGVPQYLFHPADTRYPPMIVGSKAVPTANQWGLVSTKDLVWDTKKSRWPSATLQRLLGTAGDPAVEQEALLARYLRPVPRSKSVPCQHADCLDCLDCLDCPNEPCDPTWTAFNIDPAGCRDVDDLFAWRSQADGTMEFAICIADVAAIVPQGSAHDETAKLLGQTLYREGIVVEPMLPTSLSESAGSLLADGRPRRVVAAVWSVTAGTPLPTPEWRCMSLINRRTYTYESILEDADTSNTLLRFLEALGLQPGPDPHRWVEVAMVAYNRAVAARLREAGCGLLRRHQGATLDAGGYRALATATGCAELEFLGVSAGEYVSAARASEDTVAHAGLGLAEYCHATSPLRRYADLVNQRALKALLGEQEQEQDQGQEHVGNAELAEWLNDRAKEARAYERESWCLAHLSATELRSASGWILKCTETPLGHHLRIYVPAWRRIVKARKDVGCVGTVGSAVQVTAFWDTRGTPEHRFVFRAISG